MSGKTQFEGNVKVLFDRIADAQEAIQAAAEAAGTADGAGAFSVTYVFVDADFGAGFTEDIQGPTGLRGLVKSIDIYNVTEECNGDTTAARVDIGIQGGDADAYVISDDIPDPTAIGAALNLGLTAGVVGTIPVGEDILVTGIAPNDAGANTGIANVAVTINYFV